MSVVVIIMVLVACTSWASPNAAKLYSDLEHHLQSVRSVEIRYEASTDQADEKFVGRMVLIRPNRLYHDTPEWTLCVMGDEQWRYLKPQNTLIRESADRSSGWQPDAVLFELRQNFRPLSAEDLEGGRRALRLISKDPNLAASAVLEFPESGLVPEVITLRPPDGESEVRYRITSWNEKIAADDSLFEPPAVPPENVIDFRAVEREQ